MIHGMRRVFVAVVVCTLGLHGMARGAETVAPPPGNGPLLTAGLAAVQRLAVETAPDRSVGSQLQKSTLNNDRKTKIILISVVAAAAVIYVFYQLNHSPGLASGWH